MEDHLPHLFEAGRNKARREMGVPKGKITLHIDGNVIPVADFYKSGFAVSKSYNLPQRAHIELQQDARPLYSGMISYSQIEADLQHFEFKRLNPTRSEPPSDFAQDDPYIAGLLNQS